MKLGTIIVRKGRDLDIEHVRRMMPGFEVVDARRNTTWPLDVLLGWFFLFGIWPLWGEFRTHHTFTGGPMMLLDIAVHCAGIVGLNARWRIERRTK